LIATNGTFIVMKCGPLQIVTAARHSRKILLARIRFARFLSNVTPAQKLI
jgi:hypothetical protein